MRIYSRILGIITFLIALFFLGALVKFILLDADESKEKLISLTGLIPIYIVIHFLIIHRFGFNLNSDFSARQRNGILITSLISFGLLLIISTWQIFEVIELKKQEKISDKEIEELYSHLSELRTWEKQSTAYGYVGELKTKYLDQTLYYQLNIESKTPFNPALIGFTINFLDKDGFLIKSLEITDYSVKVDKDKIYGLASNSSTDIFSYEPYEVERIASWRLFVRTE